MKYSRPSSTNSASGTPCTPAAVVTTSGVFARPVRCMNPPSPALVPWTQRSRGQFAAISPGACQSKSKLTSARDRSSAQLASSAAVRSRGAPPWSAAKRGTGSRPGS